MNAQTTEALALTIVRSFDAPRAAVYAAWTDREKSMAWAGPRGFTCIAVEGDIRPGARWRLCLRRDADGVEMWQGGVYREVVPNERLVWTFAWEGDNSPPVFESVITMTLTDDGPGRTRMTFHQAPFANQNERDGHVGGWNSAFDRLQELVE